MYESIRIGVIKKTNEKQKCRYCIFVHSFIYKVVVQGLINRDKDIIQGTKLAIDCSITSLIKKKRVQGQATYYINTYS